MQRIFSLSAAAHGARGGHGDEAAVGELKILCKMCCSTFGVLRGALKGA